MLPNYLFVISLSTDGTLRLALMAQYMPVGLTNSLLRQLVRILTVNYIFTVDKYICFIYI